MALSAKLPDNTELLRLAAWDGTGVVHEFFKTAVYNDGVEYRPILTLPSDEHDDSIADAYVLVRESPGSPYWTDYILMTNMDEEPEYTAWEDSDGEVGQTVASRDTAVYCRWFRDGANSPNLFIDDDDMLMAPCVEDCGVSPDVYEMVRRFSVRFTELYDDFLLFLIRTMRGGYNADNALKHALALPRAEFMKTFGRTGSMGHCHMLCRVYDDAQKERHCDGV
jgi:hypothetical protein